MLSTDKHVKLTAIVFPAMILNNLLHATCASGAPRLLPGEPKNKGRLDKSHQTSYTFDTSSMVLPFILFHIPNRADERRQTHCPDPLYRVFVHLTHNSHRFAGLYWAECYVFLLYSIASRGANES